MSTPHATNPYAPIREWILFVAWNNGYNHYMDNSGYHPPFAKWTRTAYDAGWKAASDIKRVWAK